MRKQLSDICVGARDATQKVPVRSWRESGPEWGAKICAVHHVSPGFDATPAFQGLPDGLCPVPHWGYCFSGKLVLRYKDGTEEVIRAGDVFYMRPGHTFLTDKNEGCELIEFSDTADFQAMEKALAASKGSTK